MKHPARIHTLYQIAFYKGWGFVQTNEYGSASKGHLLQMRKSPYNFVKCEDYQHWMAKRYLFGISGADKSAYFYTMTIKGLQELSKYYSTDPKILKMKTTLFEKIFEEEDFDWIQYRF